jgi:hypothetical protein
MRDYTKIYIDGAWVEPTTFPARRGVEALKTHHYVAAGAAVLARMS